MCILSSISAREFLSPGGVVHCCHLVGNLQSPKAPNLPLDFGLFDPSIFHGWAVEESNFITCVPRGLHVA